MPIDVNKLKQRIADRGMTVEQLSEKIGIDDSTYYRKIASGGTAFSIEQVQKIVAILGLSGAEAKEIFLP